MDLDLSDDQELMRDTTARFIESACPLTRVRELADEHAGPGADYWRQAAELGWFAMLVPEEFGGGTVSGNGVADAAIVAEERGRFLQPGAFVATNAVACALATDGSEEQRAKVLPSIASGEAAVTWALASSDGDWSPGTALTRRPSGAVASCSLARAASCRTPTSPTGSSSPRPAIAACRSSSCPRARRASRFARSRGST